MAPLESLLSAFTELQFLGNHLRRLDDVMETVPEASGHENPGRLKGGVSLEGVGFRYSEGSPWILEDIHLEIRPGEKVALVGRTGAGKSTLARLLLGMHSPTTGTIRFDGRDLAALDLQALRCQMGVVLQEPFVFDDTVRANLSLLDPEMPLERVKWAARAACVDKVIERLPLGYKARLGENARILSGGERQRLCLARAIAGEPAILLLDEATSSLDLATEAAVHANLAALGCTRILIAHRLETVKDADRILVLDGGRIAQQGTYAELAAAPGPFQDILDAQEASRG
jgi:ABC-type bacteriocin/lantibiotic exporter with double-glycine peptidase domain